MEEHGTTAVANDSKLPQGGAAGSNTNNSPSYKESIASAANQLAAGSVKPASMGSGAGTSPTSSTAARGAVSTNPVTSDSNRMEESVKTFSYQKELRRADDGAIHFWYPDFEVPKGFESGYWEIYRRTRSMCDMRRDIPVPSWPAWFGSTDELFDRLEKVIAVQAGQSERVTRLLTYWTLSTWVPDALSLAPGLAIVGPGYEGDLVLHTLRHCCRFPLMFMEASASSLKNVTYPNSAMTLLFYDPHPTKKAISFLGSTTKRGYCIDVADRFRDFYGPKAIYLGEEVSAERIPHASLQVSLLPTGAASATEKAPRQTQLEVEGLQNMLMGYRLDNLVRAHHSDFDASELTSETRAIANALGACVVGSPKLQKELITLLTPTENQRQADRSTGLEAVTLEATLNLAHAGKVQILVGEIAGEVNRVGKERGERLLYSAETIGHRLKKVGLITRRLGKAGNGLLMDVATLTRTHELVTEYGGVGLAQEEKNLQCQFCA